MTISGRIYRLLLTAYPATFRREYGGMMEQLFKDQLKDAVARKQLIHFWGRIAVDLIRTAPAFYWDYSADHTGGIMLLRRTVAVALAVFLTSVGVRMSFYGDSSWFISFAPWHWGLRWARSLIAEIALFTALNALILAAAFGGFLFVMLRFTWSRFVRGLLIALPIFAIGRIGWVLLTLWPLPPFLAHLPPFQPDFVVRNLGLQWLPVFLGLATAIRVTRSIRAKAV
jgi:hypothetical protein